MNQEIKQRWLDALRSGEYKQGHDMLRNGNQFCCLGVLCDLHAKEKGVVWEEDSGGLGLYYHYLGRDLRLPDEVTGWAGLGATDPIIKGTTLAGHNDGHPKTRDPKSFEKIADLIEENL